MALQATREQIAEELRKREAAEAHLIDFCAYTHPTWKTGAHHVKMCAALEALERGDIDKLVVNAPPRHSKSEIASRRFPAWSFGHHPGWQIALASYGDELAEDLSRNVRNIMRDPYYHAVFENLSLSNETTAAGRWETTAGGIFVAVGIGGALTGRGADLGIVDDPFEDRQNADSPRIREIVWQWYHGVFVTRLMPGGRQLIMCTRWHEDDLVGRLLETEGERPEGDWEHLNLCGIQDEGTDHETALWPEQFPYEVMSKKRSDLIRAGRAREWNAQYKGNPTPEEGTYMKREWFKTRWEGAAPSPMRIYMATDFAVTDADDARDPDWTIFGVFGVATDSKLYVLDWWRGKTSPDVWFDVLIDLVSRWKPLDVCSGKGLIRRSIEKPLLARCNERKVWFNNVWIDEMVDKTVKGRAFQARASMGNVIFPSSRQAPWVDEVIEEIVGFPTRKHDDDFDCAAVMCLHLDEAPAPPLPEAKPAVNKDRWRTVETTPAERWKVL